MRATLVHNPEAGTGSPSTDELVGILSDAGISARPHLAGDKNLPKVLERASGLVIAAGGDGTIARVITQVRAPEARVAILPLGTANNIARSFGIGGPVEEVAAGLKHGSERRIDIGLAEGPFEARRFLEAVGIGALADITSRKVKEEGSLAKQVERGRDALRKALRKMKPIKVELAWDDKSLKEEVLLLEIMNIGFIGPNLRLGVEADPGDGCFDVVYVPADGRKEMLEWLEEPERRSAPVSSERGRSFVLQRSGATLRIGDKPVRGTEGEVLVAIEHPSRTLLVPSEPLSQRKVASPQQDVKTKGDSR